ncbi:hypothetical protein M1403_03910 [Patescibacteria group bacterium]|nr:hypothetical protein [Patescibacteria group bacterium]
MIQKIDLPVSVAFTDSPKKLLFEGREHLIKKVGYHHVFREGRTLFHVFSVASDSMFFRLVLNTETLKWRLTEVADGEVI